MDTNQLWKERFQSHIKMVSRYMRLIFNDHLAFAMIFFVAAFAYFYQAWLETVPDTFPVEWVVVGIVGALLTYSPVRTFFKEADTVFLLPVENKLKPYVRNAVIYSFVMQSYWIAIALFALTPLYLQIYDHVSASYILVMIVFALVVKVGNLFATWFMQKTRDMRYHYFDMAIRLIINAFIMYFLAIGVPYYALIGALLIVGVCFLNYHNLYKGFTLPWDRLIDQEDAKLQFFYRIANMSTDVPDLKRKPKKRHGLVRLITGRMPISRKETFKYLYAITFIRSGDYFGMYLRLVALALFFVFWVPAFWGKMLFAVLFLFMSGFQFIAIYNHHRTVEWLRLYPVAVDVRRKAVHQLILVIMVVQVVITTIGFVWASDWVNALIYLSIAAAFTVLFEAFYVRGRIRAFKG
ncbi:ABC transporter permease [Alkalibacillus almallahensis]|uniref:ABC transporter permease n=1 Tax=Alkalibacillus almallahensis TaxID=1379154 RepID=UPI00141E2C59|nr:ABC transporter permease [Alkalibacillus almallahensis]NIK12652.1 ABC-2 type transport system permease protein [Alkalibacillus almallahensis]